MLGLASALLGAAFGFRVGDAALGHPDRSVETEEEQMMSIHETMSAEIGHTAAELPSRRRTRATRVIAGFMAASGVLFGTFTAVFGIVAESQQIHAFHNTVVASLLLVLSTPPAIAIARNPDHPLAALKIPELPT